MINLLHNYILICKYFCYRYASFFFGKNASSLFNAVMIAVKCNCVATRMSYVFFGVARFVELRFFICHTQQVCVYIYL